MAKHTVGGTAPSKDKSQRLEEVAQEQRANRPVGLTKARKWALGVTSVLSLVTLCSLSFMAGAEQLGSNPTATPTVSYTATQVVDSVTGKTPDEDKQDAVNALKTILASYKTSEGTYQQRVANIEAGDNSTISEEMENAVHFYGSFETDTELQSITYQSLVSISGGTLGNQDPILYREDAWQVVEVDSQKGVAYVPVSIFTGSDSIPLVFEMVYIDGQWKVSPYSLLQDIKVADRLFTAQQAQATANPSAGQ